MDPQQPPVPAKPEDDNAAPQPETPARSHPDPLLTFDDPQPGQDASESVLMPQAKPAKPKKKRWFKALIVAAGVLLLGGGTAAAYYGYYLPNQPENILKSALANTFSNEGIQSAYIDGELAIKDTAQDMTLKGTFKGKGDSKGNLELSGKLDMLVANITFDVRSVDGSYYFKVGGLKGLPELLGLSDDPSVQAYASMIESFDGQWLEINESFINQMTGSENGLTLSEADLQKLADIYERHAFLKVKEVLPNETIKDMDSYHYRVVLDETELLAAMQELKDAKLKDLKLTQEGFDNFKEALDKVDPAKYPFDIWIDKDTKTINQLGMTFSQDGMSATVRMTLYDLNKPVTVEKPEGAKSLLEVMGGVMSALMGGTAEDPSQLMQQLEQLEAGGISL